MTPFIRYAINTTLVIVSAALALYFTEIIYREFEPADQRMLFHKQEFAFFQYDPELGWANTPNTQGRMEREDFSTAISINSDGMRYHEVGPKKKFRVAVLGDSFTWGHGIEQDQRFTDILEKNLGIEMLNFAVTGYGPIQYYLQLDKVLSFKPDMILLVFCLSNDFGDNVTNYRYLHYKPYAEGQNGKLVIKGIPVPDKGLFGEDIRPSLTRYALGRFFYMHFNRWMDTPPIDEVQSAQGLTGYRDQMLKKYPDSKAVREAGRINAAILEAIRDKLSAHGVKFMVFAPPTRPGKSDEQALKLLKAETKALGITLETANGFFGQNYFYEHDVHWNPEGHAKIAEMLTPPLKEQANPH